MITEADPATGFVELSNFIGKAADLSGWSLVTTTGTVPLPSGLTIQPGKATVIARDARTFRAKYGSAAAVTELKGLALNADRDFVKLQKAQTPVDMVAWGAAAPGWALPGRAPLCRTTAGKDTNTYLDWAQAAKGTPGLPGCAGQ